MTYFLSIALVSGLLFLNEKLGSLYLAQGSMVLRPWLGLPTNFFDLVHDLHSISCNGLCPLIPKLNQLGSCSMAH